MPLNVRTVRSIRRSRGYVAFPLGNRSLHENTKEALIVLLEIVLLLSCKLYRWQRSGVLAEIERTSINQEWEPIFHQIYADMNGKIDRKPLNWSI